MAAGLSLVKVRSCTGKAGALTLETQRGKNDCTNGDWDADSASTVLRHVLGSAGLGFKILEKTAQRLE